MRARTSATGSGFSTIAMPGTTKRRMRPRPLRLFSVGRSGSGPGQDVGEQPGVDVVRFAIDVDVAARVFRGEQRDAESGAAPISSST